MVPEIRSVLWFADNSGVNSANEAALWSLNQAKAKIEIKRASYGIPYHEGLLTTSQGRTVKISLFSSSMKRDNFVKAVANSANAILLTGTCLGRPEAVKLGDIIGIKECYHISRGAIHHQDGSVQFNKSSLSATKDVQSALLQLQQAKLEHSQEIPVSIEIRRDWMLDHLNAAGIPLPLKALLTFIENDKQWKKSGKWLMEKGLISIENRTVELTEQGKEYCRNNKLVGFVEPSKNIQVHTGMIVTSFSERGDLKKKEDWAKFDIEGLPSILGLDNDTFDMLEEYPNLIAVKAVKSVGESKVEDDQNNIIQKAAATAMMQVIENL